MTTQETPRNTTGTPVRWLAIILLLALVLRLAYILPLPVDDTIYGGDYSWYAREGRMLVRTGWTYGPMPTGPVFLLVAGYAEEIGNLGRQALPGYLLQRMLGGPTLFPDPIGNGVPVVRLLNAILGTLTVWMAFRIGRAGWQTRVGLWAALLLALNPLFIVETGNPTTETIAIFLLSWTLAVWLENIHTPRWAALASVGVLLALTALTRSVFLGLPALLLVHLALRQPIRAALRGGVIMILAMLLTIAPWTAYNLITWNRLTLTGEGLLGMLYVGAVGWQAPEEVDATLGVTAEETNYDDRQDAFAEGLANTILNDPAGYATTRIRELGSAILQPHNTNVFPGESIKSLVMNWLRNDRTVRGLWNLTTADAFWAKLLLYAAHYTGLFLGGLGLVMNIRRWRRLLPLYGIFAYILGIHLFLSAIPRYLFPLAIFSWIFAAAAIIQIYDQRRMARQPAPSLQ